MEQAPPIGTIVALRKNNALLSRDPMNLFIFFMVVAYFNDTRLTMLPVHIPPSLNHVFAKTLWDMDDSNLRDFYNTLSIESPQFKDESYVFRFASRHEFNTVSDAYNVLRPFREVFEDFGDPRFSDLDFQSMEQALPRLSMIESMFLGGEPFLPASPQIQL